MKLIVRVPHRIREPNIRVLAENYLRFAGKYASVELQEADYLDRKGQVKPEVMTLIAGSRAFLLSEKAETVDSDWFLNQLRTSLTTSQNLVFLIGSATGFPQQLLDLKLASVSLTRLTLPHEWATLMVLEQLWRAVSRNNNHPYHK